MTDNQKSFGLWPRFSFWLITASAMFSILASSGLVSFDVSKLMPDLNAESEANMVKSSIALKAGQTKILIRSLGIASPIVFPASTDLAELKQALDQGVVHYPLSAFPNESSGNVFIFGHSSSRPFEKIPSRTVFTKLNKLEPGNEAFQPAIYLSQLPVTGSSGNQKSLLSLIFMLVSSAGLSYGLERLTAAKAKNMPSFKLTLLQKPNAKTRYLSALSSAQTLFPARPKRWYGSNVKPRQVISTW